jgi:hypothetical protein
MLVAYRYVPYFGSLQRQLLFGFNYKIGEDVHMGLRERVKMLSDVLQSCEGCKHVFDHSKESPLSPRVHKREREL